MKWLGAVAVLVVLAATGSSPDGFNDARLEFFSMPAPQVQSRKPDSDPVGRRTAPQSSSGAKALFSSCAHRGEERGRLSGEGRSPGSQMDGSASVWFSTSSSLARTARAGGGSPAASCRSGPPTDARWSSAVTTRIAIPRSCSSSMSGAEPSVRYRHQRVAVTSPMGSQPGQLMGSSSSSRASSTLPRHRRPLSTSPMPMRRTSDG